MTRTGPDTWAGDVFPGLAWQMAHGKAGEYQLVAHQWKQEACTIRAWVLDSGHVAPLEMQLDADGGNRLLPWLETAAAASGARLGPSQHADLAGLWQPEEAPADLVAVCQLFDEDPYRAQPPKVRL